MHKARFVLATLLLTALTLPLPAHALMNHGIAGSRREPRGYQNNLTVDETDPRWKCVGIGNENKRRTCIRTYQRRIDRHPIRDENIDWTLKKLQSMCGHHQSIGDFNACVRMQQVNAKSRGRRTRHEREYKKTLKVEREVCRNLSTPKRIECLNRGKNLRPNNRFASQRRKLAPHIHTENLSTEYRLHQNHFRRIVKERCGMIRSKTGKKDCMRRTQKRFMQN